MYMLARALKTVWTRMHVGENPFNETCNMFSRPCLISCFTSHSTADTKGNHAGEHINIFYGFLGHSRLFQLLGVLSGLLLIFISLGLGDRVRNQNHGLKAGRIATQTPTKGLMPSIQQVGDKHVVRYEWQTFERKDN